MNHLVSGITPFLGYYSSLSIARFQSSVMFIEVKFKFKVKVEVGREREILVCARLRSIKLQSPPDSLLLTSPITQFSTRLPTTTRNHKDYYTNGRSLVSCGINQFLLYGGHQFRKLCRWMVVFFTFAFLTFKTNNRFRLFHAEPS